MHSEVDVAKASNSFVIKKIMTAGLFVAGGHYLLDLSELWCLVLYLLSWDLTNAQVEFRETVELSTSRVVKNDFLLRISIV